MNIRHKYDRREVLYVLIEETPQYFIARSPIQPLVNGGPYSVVCLSKADYEVVESTHG